MDAPGPYLLVLRALTIRWQRSGGFDHTARFDTCGAHHHFLRAPLVHGPNTLQIWIETTFVHVMGMADMAADHWFFPTYFTYFCHDHIPSDEIVHAPLLRWGAFKNPSK